MASVRVSDKEQVTLPAPIRRRLGIKSESRMEVAVRDNDIILRREGSVMNADGALHKYAKGDAEEWEAVRSAMEKSVAERSGGRGPRAPHEQSGPRG